MKWSVDCSSEQNENVNCMGGRVPKSVSCTNICELLALQLKFFPQKISHHHFLRRININDNGVCSFCQRVEEILTDSFILELHSLGVTSLFWHAFKEWLPCVEGHSTCDISLPLVIGLKPQLFQDKSLFLVARFFIWTCRTRGQCPRIEGFSLFLSHYNFKSCL